MYPKKLIIFNGPYTEDKYNQFFNPNICHICKLPSKNLITCNQCYMISYCSKEHAAMHRNSHSEICKAIARIITDKSFGDTYPSLEKWIESRKEIVGQVIPSLSRFMCQYETEMIICAKSCYVCYQQVNINPCNICYSANFCDDHQIHFNLKHKNCNELLLLLNMNITYTNGYVKAIYLEENKFIKFPYTKPYGDIITFINNFALSQDLWIRSKQLKFPDSTHYWRLEQYIYSDYVSNPLTLYYALKESNLLPRPRTACKYIVHLIDASRIDIKYLKIWHIFLHLLRNIKELYVVFIKSPTFESHDLGSLCYKCFQDRQKLYVKHVSEPYHDYIHLESYEEPDVIVLLEIEGIFVGTWFESITAIIAQECPLLLITDSENTAQENVDKIQEETGTIRNRLYRKN